MSETRWTAGPWKFGNTGPEQIMILGDNGQYAASVQIHQTPREFGLWQEPERTANAHLIAAAPDLYEALDGLLRLVENNWLDEDDEEWELYDCYRAALAKARGERDE